MWTFSIMNHFWFPHSFCIIMRYLFASREINRSVRNCRLPKDECFSSDSMKNTIISYRWLCSMNCETYSNFEQRWAHYRATNQKCHSYSFLWWPNIFIGWRLLSFSFSIAVITASTINKQWFHDKTLKFSGKYF